MPTPAIRLSKRQSDALGVICSLNKDAFERLLKAVNPSQVTISRRKLEVAISRAMPRSADAASVGKFLFGLALSIRRMSVTPSEMLEAITDDIAASMQDDATFTRWREVRPEMERLLSAPSLLLSAKAFDIAYDFERVYTSGRMITSIRPVFDEGDKSEIVGTTIVQTLRLEYSSREGERSGLSVALDLDDVKKLERSCREAIKKAESSMRLMQEKCGVEAIMIGEGKDE